MSDEIRVFGAGPPDACVMLVGEAWGEKEEREGRPFVGVSGDELSRYLSSIRLSRDQVYITNLVNERPPGNSDPTAEMIRRHEGRLREELLLVRPEFVVTLGWYSTTWFLGPESKQVKQLMAREHGIGHEVTLCTGHAIPGGCDDCGPEAIWTTCLVVAYHPAYGLYRPEEQCVIATDFEGYPGMPWGLGPIMRGEVPRHPPVDAHPHTEYSEITTAADVEWFLGHAKVVAVDTEGSVSAPWCLSVSAAPGVAYVIAADHPEVVEAFAQWLDKYNPLVVMHYAAHDIPVLAAMGVVIRCIADTMLIDYNLGPMFAQALKMSGYRLFGVSMRDYEDLTAEVDRQLAVAYLQRVLDEGQCPACLGRGQRAIRIPAETVPAHTKTVQTKKGPAVRRIKAKVVRVHYDFGKCDVCSGDGTTWPIPAALPLWEGGKLTVWQPSALGKRARRILDDVAAGKVTAQGPTDPRKRWDSADPPDAIEPVTRALGPMPKATLNMVPRQEAVEYACADADITLRKWLLLDPLLDQWGLRAVNDVDLSVIPMLVKMEQLGMEVDTAYFSDLSAEWQQEKATLRHKLQRLVGHYVNPGSSKQVASLLFDKLGLTPVKLTRSKEAESTDDKVLEQLSTTLKEGTVGHTAVSLIKRHRALDKLDGTYARPLSQVDSDDERVRMEWKYTRTATGRLSSAKPRGSRQHRRRYIQGQNIPTRTEEGKRIRHGFVARPGYKLGSWDLSQIEWRVMAHLSQDANLLKVFRSGLDMHKMTASLVWKIPISEVTAEQRQSAKNVGFGVGFRITGHGLKAQFAQRGVIITVEEGEQFISAFMAAYPGLAAFWDDCTQAARQHGYLRAPSGRIRWVSAIHSRAPWVRDEAIRQLANFPVQEYAAYVMKRVMAVWWQRIRPALHSVGIDAECLLQLHDDLVLEFPDGAEEIIDPLIRHAMASTVKLSVPVMAEGKAGYRWSELVPIKGKEAA